MKITLFSMLFLFFNLSLVAQKNQATLLKAPLLFKREYQSEKGKKLVLQIKRNLSNSSQTSDESTFLLLDTENAIQLNPDRRKRIRNFLQASILNRDCLSSQTMLKLDGKFKLSLVSTNQECYYLLKVGGTKVNLAFGEGLNLLRKLITLK